VTDRWRNWAGNQTCAPAVVECPGTESDIVRAVVQAARRGRRVRVVGAGHSFADVACTDGVQIRLDNYDRVLHVDAEAGQVTVQAGIRIGRLNLALAARGLGLDNLGDVDYQTVAGAVSTATHGTGVRFGGLATQVVALDLVTADGSLLTCSAEQEPELFQSARVAVGALGVLSTVTLRCVPAFTLRAVEEPMRLGQVLERFDDDVAANDHFEFFWVPHTDWALTKRNNRTGEPPGGRSPVARFRDQVVMENVAFGAACRAGRLVPALIPRLARLVATGTRAEYVDRSYRVFVTPRHVHFYEMEYAIPLGQAVEAVERVRELVDRLGLRVSFPVEVRVAAGDDIPLSPATGRLTAYLAVHVYRGTPYERYFRGVEEIMDSMGGRPHWGKLHFQSAASLAGRYPQWARWQAARRRLDPEGRFANPYTDRVLGPVA
jgi:L-gulonolactone oxidase